MSKSPIYLTLDRRSHRIRITNEMLAYIGMPKYLQFLINPVEKVMLVRAIEQGTAKEQAYKVKHQPSKESYIEIHSKILIDKFAWVRNRFIPKHERIKRKDSVRQIHMFNMLLIAPIPVMIIK